MIYVWQPHPNSVVNFECSVKFNLKRWKSTNLYKQKLHYHSIVWVYQCSRQMHLNTRFLVVSRSTYYNQLFHPISSSCAICHSQLLYQPIFIPINWITGSLNHIILPLSHSVTNCLKQFLFIYPEKRSTAETNFGWFAENYLLYSSWCTERLAKLYIILNQLFINQIRFTSCCFLSLSLWFITDIHW